MADILEIEINHYRKLLDEKYREEQEYIQILINLFELGNIQYSRLSDILDHLERFKPNYRGKTMGGLT